MAIHVLNPNTIGTQTEAMFNVTNNQGRALIGNFSISIHSLKSHWKGSDAVANLTDLARVYTAVTDLIKDLQKIIVTVNNNEVLPLQQHIIASGGTCTMGSELAVSLNYDSYIDVPTDAVESWTDPAITSDAETFNDIPTSFDKFVNELNAAKDELLNNWKDGANREQVVSLFNNFNNSVVEYKKNIEKVKNNLNIVAKNKRQFI